MAEKHKCDGMFLTKDESPCLKNKNRVLYKNGKTRRYLAYAALVAAVYAVLTMEVAPLSCRHDSDSFSRNTGAVGMDKRYAPKAILGCFIANCFSPWYGGCCSLRCCCTTQQRSIIYISALVYPVPFGLYSVTLSGRGILSAAKRTAVLQHGAPLRWWISGSILCDMWFRQVTENGHD